MHDVKFFLPERLIYNLNERMFQDNRHKISIPIRRGELNRIFAGAMPMTCIYIVIRSITVSTQRIIRTINNVPQLLFPISLVVHTCQYTSSIDEAKEILQSGSNRLEIYG